MGWFFERASGKLEVRREKKIKKGHQHQSQCTSGARVALLCWER